MKEYFKNRLGTSLKFIVELTQKKPNDDDDDDDTQRNETMMIPMKTLTSVFFVASYLLSFVKKLRLHVSIFLCMTDRYIAKKRA